jgi:hypothetical protein
MNQSSVVLLEKSKLLLAARLALPTYSMRRRCDEYHAFDTQADR